MTTLDAVGQYAGKVAIKVRVPGGELLRRLLILPHTYGVTFRINLKPVERLAGGHIGNPIPDADFYILAWPGDFHNPEQEWDMPEHRAVLHILRAPKERGLRLSDTLYDSIQWRGQQIVADWLLSHRRFCCPNYFAGICH